MKKLIALALASTMVLGLASCGNSSGGNNSSAGGSTEEKSYVLKFSDQNAEGTPVIIWAEKFAELLSEKTDGTLTVEIYPNASLAAYDNLISQKNRDAPLGASLL